MLHTSDQGRADEKADSKPRYDETTVEGRRARRKAALALIDGIWKDRTDIPADGLEYQRRLREEW